MKDSEAMGKIEEADQRSLDEGRETKTSFEALPKPLTRSQGKKDGQHGSRRPSTDEKLKRVFIALVIFVAVAFGAGWLGAYAQNKHSTTSISTAKEIVTSQSQVVTAISKDVSPSVVSINATSTTQSQDIFGSVTNQQQQDAGTGIIISSNGYIVTNRHVVSGATSVSVTLADGTTINNVKVIGTTASSDPLDIAFLKINNSPETLQPALLGDSSKVQVGDNVVAIGNALGQFQNTVTSGIVSGRGRSIQAGDSTSSVSEDLQDLFQTDAPINPGNSGGPLINTNGEVIGINTALASEGAQNIGFSIPINDVEGLIKGVLSSGSIERPYLGVYYVTITPAVVKQYSLSTTNGAYIPPNQSGQNSIVSGSPADNAGLKTGDIITAVNGVNVDSDHSLSSLIDQNEVGTKVTLTVIQNGNQKSIPITIGQEPSS